MTMINDCQACYRVIKKLKASSSHMCVIKAENLTTFNQLNFV